MKIIKFKSFNEEKKDSFSVLKIWVPIELDGQLPPPPPLAIILTDWKKAHVGSLKKTK